jgi:type II secretory pathway component GspD/PulD (secretin)
VDLGSLSQGGAGGQGPRATVQFKESGIILTVTPHITNNRQILMTLHAERSQLQPAASDLGYTFLKQRADNELLVADGETAVIGGLTVTQVQQSKVGIPLLVDLPLVGKLFGETRTEETKNDLLILVTPHIIDEGEQLGPPGGE